MRVITRCLAQGLAAVTAAAGATVAAQSQIAPSLEQAVAQVQQETGGKVLSAYARPLGRHTEYRIKVLTPEGHVRVVVMSAPDAKPGAGSGDKAARPGNRGN